MALVLASPSTCLKDNCGTISITETTGAYHATTNTTGWGSPNLQGIAVTIATISITTPGATAQVIDVLSQIPDTVTGDIVFTDIELDNYTDGVTTILLTISDGTTTYTKSVEILFTCEVRSCIDKMWAKNAAAACGNSCELLSLVDDANLAEGLLKSLKSAGACNNDDCVDSILAAINQLCEFNDCNC
jgi:hypothetical protein